MSSAVMVTAILTAGAGPAPSRHVDSHPSRNDPRITETTPAEMIVNSQSCRRPNATALVTTPATGVRMSRRIPATIIASPLPCYPVPHCGERVREARPLL